MNNEFPYRNRQDRELNDREKSVLRSIVQSYILTASPVGSRFLSKSSEEFTLSPATIRNVMSDLEEMEFISHPHTSAGRVPTDKGYRMYVDSLMELEFLSENEQHVVSGQLLTSPQEQALKDASKILGSLSHYLAIVELPNLTDITVRRIQIVPLTSQRLLVVVELDSNLVRTVTLETELSYSPDLLEQTAEFINSRISGKTIRYIRDHFIGMITEGGGFHHGSLLRLFIESVDTLFKPEGSSVEKIHVAGAQNLLNYPEFDNPEQFKGVIELVESEDVIIHLLDRPEQVDQGITIRIGSELGEEKLNNYSMVLGSYTIEGANGSIGLIGPKRMNYSKMVSLVNYVGSILSKRTS